MRYLKNESCGLLLVGKSDTDYLTFSYTFPRYVRQGLYNLSGKEGSIYVEINNAEARELLVDNFPGSLSTFEEYTGTTEFIPHTHEEAMSLVSAWGTKEIVEESTKTLAEWPLDFANKRYVVVEPLIERWGVIDINGKCFTTFGTKANAEAAYPQHRIIHLREVR